MVQMTKRQLVMFIFFIIYFAYTLFSAAINQDIYVIVSNLAVVLFLAALYLENNLNSKYILVLASAMMIINAIFTFVRIPMLILTVQGILNILLYIAVYLFALNYHQGRFQNKQRNLLVTLLSLPIAGYSLYYFYLYGTALYNVLPIGSYLQLIIGWLLGVIVPAAMITYTYMRTKRIY